MEENGLTDPAELLAEGNWTWDTFREMCLEYCDREADQFAYDSWYFETQFLLTTGVAPISMENGMVPLRNACRNLVFNGYTSVQELMSLSVE